MDAMWFSALLGGVMIGGAATLLFLVNGKIAGVSGILGKLLERNTLDRGWRIAFVVGLVAGGALGLVLWPERSQVQIDASMPMLVAAGLLVGWGARWGGGCTSGHGVCGVSRFSVRSLVATLTFVTTGMITVFIVQHGGV